MRTTSSLEAFNSALNKTLPRRANFFKFVQCLKTHEFSKFSDLFNHFNSLCEIKVRKRKLDRIRDQKIKRNFNLFNTKKIKLSEYLEAVSATDILSSMEED